VDALAKLLVEKGLITREEFIQKISEGPATYQKLLKQADH
jgi:dihydroorotase-like cyclic amidohydrolase